MAITHVVASVCSSRRVVTIITRTANDRIQSEQEEKKEKERKEVQWLPEYERRICVSPWEPLMQVRNATNYIVFYCDPFLVRDFTATVIDRRQPTHTYNYKQLIGASLKLFAEIVEHYYRVIEKSEGKLRDTGKLPPLKRAAVERFFLSKYLKNISVGCETSFCCNNIDQVFVCTSTFTELRW